jgi:hypothetical protein
VVVTKALSAGALCVGVTGTVVPAFALFGAVVLLGFSFGAVTVISGSIVWLCACSVAAWNADAEPARARIQTICGRIMESPGCLRTDKFGKNAADGERERQASISAGGARA